MHTRDSHMHTHICMKETMLTHMPIAAHLYSSLVMLGDTINSIDTLLVSRGDYWQYRLQIYFIHLILLGVYII